MSQHDYDIANAAGATVRADINNALVAGQTNNAGNAYPATTFARQIVVREDTNKIYMRNSANTDWIELPIYVDSDLAVTARKVTVNRGSGAMPAGPRISILEDISNASAALLEADHLSYVGRMLSLKSTRTGNSAFDFIACYSDDGADIEFRVRGDGEVYADGGTAMNTPADYAEMFEWADGNPKHHDRVGLSVVLEDGLLREAVEGDDPIGIISGNPAITGDAAWGRWAGKYQVDDFNRIQIDGSGARKLAKDFDPEKEYTPRQERPEWSAVGLLGKLRLRKGQVTGSRWVKLRDISEDVEEWLVR